MKKLLMISIIFLFTSLASALENWECKALEFKIINYHAWAENAVSKGIYKNTDQALKAKLQSCLNMMYQEYLYIVNAVPYMDDRSKVNLILSLPKYQDRDKIEADKFSKIQIEKEQVNYDIEIIKLKNEIKELKEL